MQKFYSTEKNTSRKTWLCFYGFLLLNTQKTVGLAKRLPHRSRQCSLPGTPAASFGDAKQGPFCFLTQNTKWSSKAAAVVDFRVEKHGSACQTSSRVFHYVASSGAPELWILCEWGGRGMAKSQPSISTQCLLPRQHHSDQSLKIMPLTTLNLFRQLAFLFS